MFTHSRHISYSSSTTVIPYAPSDHDAVVVSFSRSSSSPHVLWRYNTSLLPLPHLQTSIRALLSPYISPVHWDATKIITRSHAQDLALQATRSRQAARRFLERQLAKALRRAARDVSDSAAAFAALDCRKRLDACLTQETSRAILRARLRWFEEGETCSPYFFKRFRSYSQSSSLSLLCDSDGSSFSDSSARQEHIISYYSHLCAAPTFSSDACFSFLSPLSLPRLSSAQCTLLLAPFTAKELLTTIKALPLRRAPGPDGIPYEWYQTFVDDLVPILLPLYNSVLAGGPIPPSWSRTLVSLIPKPDRDLSSLANWRPITLANCDVKIYSRMLATRLATVLPALISPHQAGFVQGRNAADIAMALRNVLGHAAEHHVDGAFVFLDQEKAYDRISHPYLSAVLTSFGFPLPLQYALSATYSDTTAFFLDDGHPVGPVQVACGVRQGDPLAPLLFNLAFEPLLTALRLRLTGLQLPWGPF